MVGTRGNFSTFAFYANKQMTTGEGGMIVPTDPDAAARLRSERNQGRAVDMGWLDHDRLGFNYRLSDVAGGDRPRPGGEAAAAAGAARRGRRRLRRAARRGARGRGADRRPRPRGAQLVRLRRPARRRGRPRRGDPCACASAASTRSPTCRAIHLFPHIAALGYREGQFPIAEAASAHSLALPFFPSLTEAQIERVCTELAAAVDATRRDRRTNIIWRRWHASQDKTATATRRRGSAKSPTRASGG